jgi:SAM-dependent methyltransferase
MTAGLPVYEASLATGSGTLLTNRGRRTVLPIGTWVKGPTDADHALLDRCVGRTLDVGCGPGRLTAALLLRGTRALGIDLSEHAVELATARGATAQCGDVFTHELGRASWAHVLLADGNIGIGGDPVRLLVRCAELLDHRGSVLLDTAPPGTGLVQRRVRLESGGRRSRWFEWAWVGVDCLDTIAAPAGLGVAARWRVGDRWQAELRRTETWERPCGQRTGAGA